jgi:uncharacterized protein YjbI with pentapeptide repeats
MACCKADEYGGWCNEAGMLYVTASDRREYCVFHAPKGEKGISLDEFNELVKERIRRTGKDETCHLRGTVFEGDISFKEFGENAPLPAIDFSKATFGGANFYEATFGGKAFFVAAAFGGCADFNQATFGGKAYFSRAKFDGAALFIKTRFDGEAFFYGARFDGEANFSDATFGGKADFHDATFDGQTFFTEARFGGKADFHGATFARPAYFRNLVLDEKGGLRFEKTHLGNVSFLNTDMKRLDFVNCTWDRRFGRDILYDEMALRLGKDYISRPAPDTFGKVTEYFHDRLAYIASSFRRYKRDEAVMVERVYNGLKQKYKAEHNEPRVSDWHYGEKEMQSKKSPWALFNPLLGLFNPLGLLNLYWLSSGYGERPFRAGVVLAGLIIAATLLLAAFGGLQPFDPSKPLYGLAGIGGLGDVLSSWKTFSAAVLNTFQYVTFQKVTVFTPTTLAGGWIRSAAQVLVPLQAALLALAVRNRFRR